MKSEDESLALHCQDSCGWAVPGAVWRVTHVNLSRGLYKSHFLYLHVYFFQFIGAILLFIYTCKISYYPLLAFYCALSIICSTNDSPVYLNMPKLKIHIYLLA